MENYKEKIIKTLSASCDPDDIYDKCMTIAAQESKEAVSWFQELWSSNDDKLAEMLEIKKDGV